MRTASVHYREKFGCKVYKLSLDGGFTCPNRDGSLGTGGCIFCSAYGGGEFAAAYQSSIAEQLEQAKARVAAKNPSGKYIAYFQSFTGTYAKPDRLRQLYYDAIAPEDIVGLAIGTRPDCMPPELLQYLSELNRRTFLIVEYGVESANEETLLRINRGHTFALSAQVIRQTAACGIRVGAHVILGFPWEGRQELMRQADELAHLPLTTLKLHQLQIIRDTPLAAEYAANPWPLPTAKEYVDLVLDYISHLPADLVLECFVSQSPPEYVVAPKWGLKNHEFADLVRRELVRLG